MNIHLSPISANHKTGPMPVSSSPSITCPSKCPLKDHGCYGEYGPVFFHWQKVNDGNRGMPWEEFIGVVTDLFPGTLWRHNQVGDLPHDQDEIDEEKAIQLVLANIGKRGFTYTHHDVLHSSHNRKIIRMMNDSGFTVNLSADSIDEADAKARLSIGPVVTMLPKEPPWPRETPGGRKIVVCLNVSMNITCLQCGLCQVASRRSIVGFPVHGTGWRKAQHILDRNNAIREVKND